MRVIGFDPRAAAHRLGRDRDRGHAPAPCGERRACSRTTSSTSGPAPAAARRGPAARILRRHLPGEAAVESTLVNKNASSTLKLGVARGVVLLTPAQARAAGGRVPAHDRQEGGGRQRPRHQGAGPEHGRPSAARLRRSPTRMPPMPLAVAICHSHHAATSRRWAGGEENPLHALQGARR